MFKDKRYYIEKTKEILGMVLTSTVFVALVFAMILLSPYIQK